MTPRLGPGPVFKYEWLAATRRWQLYALRSFFVAAILVGLSLAWISRRPTGPYVPLRELANFGSTLYSTIVTIQLIVILFAAPAATAGAICLDKARGTLDHVLATDLSNAEIVLGKLGARLIPVVGLVACALPVMVLGSLLGGIDPDSLFGSFFVTLGVAAVSCTLALAISVWGRKTQEVLITTYLVLLAWIAGPVLIAVIMGELYGIMASISTWRAFRHSNPFYLVTASYSEPGAVGYAHWLAFLGICLVLSAALVALATARIRIVALAQAGRAETRDPKIRKRRLGRWLHREWKISKLPGPSLDGNPVLWREWHRSRPSRWMRVIWGIYGLSGLVLTVLAINAGTSPNSGLAEGATVTMVNLGLLLLSVQAATSLAEERTRGSLDVLLTTPITTLEVLIGKWIGAFRLVPKILFLPFVVTLYLAIDSGRWGPWLLFLMLMTAFGASVTSAGVACATWIPRLGRAIGASVACLILFNAVVIAALAVAVHVSTETVAISIATAGTLYGTLFSTLDIRSGQLATNDFKNDFWFSTIRNCAFHFWMAISLLFATWKTFDRCLGRASGRRGQDPNAPEQP